MIIRSGKFGEFYCCPRSNPSDNHGTAPISQRERGHPLGPNLDQLIQRQMMYFGGGRISDLDLFVEGGEETANDEPDHWMNTRPY